MTPTPRQAAGMEPPAPPVTARDKVKALTKRLKVAEAELAAAVKARAAAKASHDDARKKNEQVQQVLRAAAEEVVHSRGKYEAAHDVVDAMTRAVNQLSGEIAALTGAKPPVTA